MSKTWTVTNAKTNEVLGTVSRFYKNVGTLAKPHWRVWFELVGNPSINADTRACVAAYLGGCVNAKTKMTAN